MPANREPLHEASDKHSYYYRRSLSTGDYLMATAVGLGVGLAAFYVATRFAQRTLLLDESKVAELPRRQRVQGRAG